MTGLLGHIKVPMGRRGRVLASIFALGVAVFTALAFVAVASLVTGCAGPADAGGRTSGNSFSAAIYVQGNPNGRVVAAKGTVGADERTGNLYKNTNGSKAWVPLLSGIGGGDGDITSIVAGNGLLDSGDCEGGDCQLDVECGPGLVCDPDMVNLRDDCLPGDPLVFAPNGEGPNEWQCAHSIAAGYRLLRYVTPTVNGGLAVAMDDTDTTARKAFVHLRDDCADGEVLVSGASGATWSCSAMSSGVTNSAGNAIVPVSDGTNLVASSLASSGNAASNVGSFTVNTGQANEGIYLLQQSGGGASAWQCTASNGNCGNTGDTNTTGTTTSAHFKGATAPTLSSCGTSPTIQANSNSMGGRFTTGSATGTSCTLTWATAAPAPKLCVLFTCNSAASVRTATASSTTAATWASVLNSSTEYCYMCSGNVTAY